MNNNAGQQQQQQQFEGGELVDEDKRDRHLRVMTERLAKIEHDFSDAKLSLYKEKLEALRREMKEIQEGSHPEFQRRLKMLETEREMLVKKAAYWREYQVEITEAMYKTEIEQAEQEYTAEKEGLKDKILQQIEERRKRIREERESLSIDNDQSASALRSSGRKLRKRAQMEILDSRGKRSRMQQQNPVLNPLLKESDIMQDFMVLSKYLTKKVTKRGQRK